MEAFSRGPSPLRLKAQRGGPVRVDPDPTQVSGLCTHDRSPQTTGRALP